MVYDCLIVVSTAWREVDLGVCLWMSVLQGASKHYGFAEFALPSSALPALQAINRRFSSDASNNKR